MENVGRDEYVMKWWEGDKAYSDDEREVAR